MYPCLLLKVLAVHDLQLCVCSKRDSCEPVFPVRLREGIHAQVTSQGGGGASLWFRLSLSLTAGKAPHSLWFRFWACQVKGFQVLGCGY